MLYDVYIWLRPTSEAAEIFQQVRATDAEDALQLVMQQCAIRSASYAWVVPEDETADCSGFEIRAGGGIC